MSCTYLFRGVAPLVDLSCLPQANQLRICRSGSAPADDQQGNHDDPDWSNSLHHASVPQSGQRLSDFRTIQEETRLNARTSNDAIASPDLRAMAAEPAPEGDLDVKPEFFIEARHRL
jgi:hypothetical protein